MKSLTLSAKRRDELEAQLVASYLANGGEVKQLPAGRGSGYSRREWREAVRGDAKLEPREQREARAFMDKVLKAYESGGVEAALALVEG